MRYRGQSSVVGVFKRLLTGKAFPGGARKSRRQVPARQFDRQGLADSAANWAMFLAQLLVGCTRPCPAVALILLLNALSLGIEIVSAARFKTARLICYLLSLARSSYPL